MFSDNNSKTFTIKDYTFGNGTPRICVPVIGRTDEEIMSHAKVIRAELDRLDAKYPDREDLKVAVIEWRSDFYNDVATPEKVTTVLENLREIGCFFSPLEARSRAESFAMIELELIWKMYIRM